MSDEETHILQTEEGQMLTAEYKDGQLQIVEVSAFDKGNDIQASSDGTKRQETKYLQIDSKGLMQLDLLNFTLVKCSEDSSSTSYQVLGSNDDGNTTLTCVLADEENQDSLDNTDSYVVVNSNEGKGPLVYLESTLQQINTQENLKNDDKEKKALTPAEILEKAKAFQKAKALLEAESQIRPTRGRKRKSDLPTPMELLNSPNFKLYLYSCKLCPFKCNAVKEMTKHKSTEHAAGRGRGAGAPRGSGAAMQCARCPYRGHTHTQLLKHTEEAHLEEQDDSSGELKLDCDEPVSTPDVLVCGACGFESSLHGVFRRHVAKEHGVDVTLATSLITIEESSD